MHFLCLPGQTLAGRPVGLLTPRDTVPLPSWQGDGALRALSVQDGPPRQEQLTPWGAGRLEAQPVPTETLPCQWWGQWGGRAGSCLCFPWGLPWVGTRVFLKISGFSFNLTLSVGNRGLLGSLSESNPAVLRWHCWRDHRWYHSCCHSHGSDFKANTFFKKGLGPSSSQNRFTSPHPAPWIWVDFQDFVPIQGGNVL